MSFKKLINKKFIYSNKMILKVFLKNKTKKIILIKRFCVLYTLINNNY